MPPFLQKKIYVLNIKMKILYWEEKKDICSDAQIRFLPQIWWKNKDFYCYLLLAAENLLLAEQLQISASSSASKLPARANTTCPQLVAVYPALLYFWSLFNKAL